MPTVKKPTPYILPKDVDLNYTLVFSIVSMYIQVNIKVSYLSVYGTVNKPFSFFVSYHEKIIFTIELFIILVKMKWTNINKFSLKKNYRLVLIVSNS